MSTTGAFILIIKKKIILLSGEILKIFKANLKSINNYF